MPGARARGMSRLWRDDEELAKKDDDLKLSSHNSQWQSARTPRRSTISRLAALVALIFFLVFCASRFFGQEPTSADPYDLGRGPVSSPRLDPLQRVPPPAIAVPPRPGTPAIEDLPRTFSEPVKFPALATTLKFIGETSGDKLMNRNVLFIAASFRSVSELLPLACKMSKERESYVHFVYVGRSILPMKSILQVNGVDSGCSIIPHGASLSYSKIID